MTLFRRKNSSESTLAAVFRNEPYIIINLISALVILLVIAYSGIFSPDKDNYPVVCMHEKITGVPCVSCGLSHSFSLIVRGRISEALSRNVYGLRVFIFFASQLAMRVVFSSLFITHPETRRQLIIYDIACTVILFLTAFYPFIEFIFRNNLFRAL